MLQLHNIELTQFKNHLHFKHNFSTKIIGICGSNGSGKTNLLDAIYYLSFCKSYFSKTDSANVTHNHKGFRLVANYSLQNNDTNITCILRENNKKEFYCNNDEYAKLSKHIGLLPCVVIAPDDIEIITGASEARRKFIDVILSQTNYAYLQNIIAYNNLLQQRNSLLKQYAINGKLDDVLFDITTQQLIQYGNLIFTERQVFLKEFVAMVVTNYTAISSNKEVLTCAYQSQLIEKKIEDLLQQNLQSDFALQRTTVGVHKDDVDFLLNDIKFKTEASQGQKKSLLFALKLSEWQWLQKQKGFSPLLLLDDVFEKLDENRMTNLLHFVSKNSDAQIFITDTHKDRLTTHLNQLNIDFEIIEL